MQPLVGRGLSLLGREAAKIVLPSHCIVCEENLPWTGRVASCCSRCWQDLPRMESASCRRCGCAWRGGTTSDSFTCLDCHTRNWSLEWIASWGPYERGLENVMSAFKFRGHDFLAPALGGLLHEVLLERSDVYFDRIVPIPLHPRKLRSRGYNQAELLARALGSRIGVRTENVLRKKKDNQMQSQLPKAERAANVRDAFESRRSLSADRVLLVDDICTTGETLEAAARVLKSAGASSVCAITLCRA